jgi:Predicted NADH:ubiquinone oxidoreductase, subunit RnfD
LCPHADCRTDASRIVSISHEQGRIKAHGKPGYFQKHLYSYLGSALALRENLQKNMLHTLLAILPVMAMAVYRYGYDAVEVMAWAGLTAVVTEALVQKIMNQAPSSDDFSALVDGLLFAFLLPATAPGWMVIIGSSLMIILGRMVFGGFGGSPICAPALGWAILAIPGRISWI